MGRGRERRDASPPKWLDVQKFLDGSISEGCPPTITAQPLDKNLNADLLFYKNCIENITELDTTILSTL